MQGRLARVASYHRLLDNKITDATLGKIVHLVIAFSFKRYAQEQKEHTSDPQIPDRTGLVEVQWVDRLGKSPVFFTWTMTSSGPAEVDVAWL